MKETTLNEEKKYTLGFIGCGAMAQALINGLLKSESASSLISQIVACDISQQAKEYCNKNEIKFYNNASNMLSSLEVDIIMVCVKPDQLKSVLADTNERKQRNCLLISICAGITISTIREDISNSSCFSNEIRIVRVMPNVNCMVQEGAMGYVLEKENQQDKNIVESLLCPCGIIIQLQNEKFMHGVTGLSGSGPAFVFQFIEALSDGGVRSGLPRDIALKLAAQTVLGSAKMILETGKHPGVLKDMVTSPGGTTIAGVHALESGGMRASVMDAVYSASNRSIELSKL